MAESYSLSEASGPAVAAELDQAEATGREPVSASPASSWPLAVLTIYVVGFLLFLFRLVIGIGRARQLMRRGRPIPSDPRRTVTPL